MIRRFFVSLLLALVIILGFNASPVLAEKQYSQLEQMPTQTDQTFKQEPYTQSEQTFKQEPYTQSQQTFKQEPYTQSQQTIQQEPYTQSEQKPKTSEKS